MRDRKAEEAADAVREEARDEARLREDVLLRQAAIQRRLKSLIAQAEVLRRRGA